MSNTLFLILLDLIYPHAPVRIQHRINRYWTRSWIQLNLRVQEQQGRRQ